MSGLLKYATLAYSRATIEDMRRAVDTVRYTACDKTSYQDGKELQRKTKDTIHCFHLDQFIF